MDLVAKVFLVGIGATAVLDAWSLVREHVFRVPAPDYALVGRWIAYMRRGTFRHVAIAGAAPVRRERLLGWTTHYAVGVVFAALLAAAAGPGWFAQPRLVPALLVGIGTVAAPFLLMQPGMGAGFFASRTPRPLSARLHSLVNHAVFGAGLWVSGTAIDTLPLP